MANFNQSGDGGESESYLNHSSESVLTDPTYSSSYQLHELPIYEICVLLVVGTFCMTVNVGAYWVVKSRRGPPTFLSMINLFISSLLAVMYQIFKTLRQNGVLGQESIWLCYSWGLCSRICIVILSFTMVGIFYEITNAKRLIRCGKRLEVAVFISVWIATILISFPGMDTYKFQDSGNSSIPQCARVFIRDSKLLHTSYEALFVSSISILPTSYMIFALYSIKFRIELLLLCQTIPPGLHKKVRKIRCVFLYTVFFIVFWLIPGPVIFIVRLTDKRTENQTGERKVPQDFSLFVRCFLLIQVALQPFFFLYAQHEFNLCGWFQSCSLIKCLRSTVANRRASFLRDRVDRSSAMHMETFAISTQNQPRICY